MRHLKADFEKDFPYMKFEVNSAGEYANSVTRLCFHVYSKTRLKSTNDENTDECEVSPLWNLDD